MSFRRASKLHLRNLQLHADVLRAAGALAKTNQLAAACCLAASLVVCAAGCTSLVHVKQGAAELKENAVSTAYDVKYGTLHHLGWATTSTRSCLALHAEHPRVSKHFKHGFKSGFAHYTRTRVSIPPPLPPAGYLVWPENDEHGQQAIAAWYEGYTAGVSAAARRSLHTAEIAPPGGEVELSIPDAEVIPVHPAGKAVDQLFHAPGDDFESENEPQ